MAISSASRTARRAVGGVTFPKRTRATDRGIAVHFRRKGAAKKALSPAQKRQATLIPVKGTRSGKLGIRRSVKATRKGRTPTPYLDKALLTARRWKIPADTSLKRTRWRMFDGLEKWGAFSPTMVIEAEADFLRLGKGMSRGEAGELAKTTYWSRKAAGWAKKVKKGAVLDMNARERRIIYERIERFGLLKPRVIIRTETRALMAQLGISEKTALDIAGDAYIMRHARARLEELGDAATVPNLRIQRTLIERRLHPVLALLKAGVH